MTDYESKEYKQAAADRLAAIDVGKYGLERIDGRLLDYVSEVRANPDGHNLYEVLAVIKFFRLMDRYVFRPSKIQKFAKMFESLKFSGLDGRRCYSLTPIQFFQFASILGFYRWERAGDAAPGEKDSQSQTRKVESGSVYELRRLVRDAILFVPRKFSKTTSTASLAVNELFFGDANAQAYTAANSYPQAKICFDEIKKIMMQIDRKKQNFIFNRERVSWKLGNKMGKESFVECLTGGAETKDGLAASLVIFDEYAQARYTRDHSEGAELLEVLKSSMGTRKEPLTIIITTASRVQNGPFSFLLEEAKRVLREEYSDDSQFASIFQPDAWEMDEEHFGLESVWRKCNPHIGVTIQESWYSDKWEKAQHDPEGMIEFKTKMLNVFVNDTIQDWMPLRITRKLVDERFDIDAAVGRPETMCALDLSLCDDMSVVVYNSYIRSQRKFYIWLDAYVPEYCLDNHPNRELYRIWKELGFLKTCPGRVIDFNMIVNGILERNRKLKILQIGYDAWKAKEVINALSAAIAKTANPDNILKAVPQTYGAFTSPVGSFELAVHSNPSRVVFGPSPILPWCFDNCYVDEDHMGNRKPVKRKANDKVDGAIATIMTFWLYNNFEHGRF